MADKVVFKMFSIIFLFIFISNVSSSLAVADKEEKCSCYNLCNKNFTTNSIHDVQKINACQRGCRFYSLVLHSSRDLNHAKGLKNAKEGCLLSCSESYINPVEASACKFGCSAVELSKVLCNAVEIQTPQITYSFLIEESDILIHPGEPEPDDSLTDPGLRKQIQKTLVALLDATPKIPEIRFRNLPVKTEKLSELSHTSFKCPKFYGLDSKFEFRNGKIIIGDLYLFVGVLIFVVLCFLLGHHIETKNIKRQLMESRLIKKDDYDVKESLLIVDSQESEIIEKESLLEYNQNKSEVFDSPESAPEQYDTKFEGITLVFHEEEFQDENKPVNKVVNGASAVSRHKSSGMD